MSKGAYSRLDVKSGWHRKTLHLGNSAWGALLRLIAIANDYGTDGHVDDETIRLVCSDDDLTRLVTPFPWSERNAPMLTRDGAGYQIHDFLEHNDSAAVIATRVRAAKRRAQAAAAARWRKTSAAPAAPDLPKDEEPPERAAARPPPAPSTTAANANAPTAPSSAPPTEAQPSAPESAEPSGVRLGPATMDGAPEVWAEGVRSVTGGLPPLAPWDRRNLEQVARAFKDEDGACERIRADGAEYARRQQSAEGLVTAQGYCEWVGSGRPRPLARARDRPAVQPWSPGDFEMPEAFARSR